MIANELSTHTFVFEAGETMSNVVDLDGLSPYAIMFDDDLSGYGLNFHVGYGDDGRMRKMIDQDGYVVMLDVQKQYSTVNLRPSYFTRLQRLALELAPQDRVIPKRGLGRLAFWRKNKVELVPKPPTTKKTVQMICCMI